MRIGLIALAALAGLGGCVAYPVPVPVAVGPSSVAPQAAGYTCLAGNYTCRTPVRLPPGSDCSCPAIGAPSFGTVY